MLFVILLGTTFIINKFLLKYNEYYLLLSGLTFIVFFLAGSSGFRPFGGNTNDKKINGEATNGEKTNRIGKSKARTTSRIAHDMEVATHKADIAKKDADIHNLICNLTNTIGQLKKLSRTLSILEGTLPNPIWKEDNTQENRMQKKKHVWLSINQNKRANVKVENIRKYIQKWYGQKNEEYKEKYTLEQYTDDVYETLAEIEEDINNLQAHVLMDTPRKKGHEFRKLVVYGKEKLDECATILVNAIGLRDLLDDDSAEYMTSGA